MNIWRRIRNRDIRKKFWKPEKIGEGMSQGVLKGYEQMLRMEGERLARGIQRTEIELERTGGGEVNRRGVYKTS